MPRPRASSALAAVGPRTPRTRPGSGRRTRVGRRRPRTRRRARRSHRRRSSPRGDASPFPSARSSSRHMRRRRRERDRAASYASAPDAAGRYQTAARARRTRRRLPIVRPVPGWFGPGPCAKALASATAAKEAVAANTIRSRFIAITSSASADQPSLSGGGSSASGIPLTFIRALPHVYSLGSAAGFPQRTCELGRMRNERPRTRLARWRLAAWLPI